MLMSLRMWLVVKAMEQGATFFEAEEAVSTTLISWKDAGLVSDPNLRTYAQWEEKYTRGKVNEDTKEVHQERA